MNPAERLRNIQLSTKLGPVTSFFGIVDGRCECGRSRSAQHKPGKHPRFKGWQAEHATTDHRIIEEWFESYPSGNFAVITGVESVVLDLDVRPGKNGVEELARLEAEAEDKMPSTVTVLSGSGTGSKHLYFKIPSNTQILQKPVGTSGIDFQRSRKAIIVAGSLHETGRFYEFAPGLSPDDIAIADLPDWLLKTMTKPLAQSRNGATTTDNIAELHDQLVKMGPPPGSSNPGRFRPDPVVMRKMKSVPMRRYTDDRSHSDSHWAWTLARNCCHHWDQFLRLWFMSEIRNLPDTKCGRASYEADILNRAFSSQRQQWKSKLTRHAVEHSANPRLTQVIRMQDGTRREVPKSDLTKAVLGLHAQEPALDDNGIARKLNATGDLSRVVTRNNVKRIRHSYPHLW